MLSLPKYLYKYSEFNEYWYNEIVKGNIFLNSPNNFNDPYDCTFVGLSRAISNRVENPKQVMEELKSKFMISSFSEVIDSFPMWAHYANTHKGYVIKYNTEKIFNSEKMNFMKVKYDNTIIDLNDNVDNNAFSEMTIADILCHKGKDWAYECEWRYVDVATGNRYVDLSESVEAVYFGLDFEQDKYYQELLTIFEASITKNFEIYKMKLSDEKFALISQRKETIEDFYS